MKKGPLKYSVTSTEALFEKWRNDPVLFAKQNFKQPPREVQPEIMMAVAKNRWTSVAACRDLGKSRIAAYLTYWFMSTRQNSLVFTVAPTWQQLEESLWTEIRSLWNTSATLPVIWPKWEVQQTAIKTQNPEWRALGVTSQKTENLEGRHAPEVLVILDESKGIPDEFFDSVQGMMSNPASKLLAIGTPGLPRGWFARSFGLDRSLWQTHFQVPYYRIPRLLEHGDNEKKRLGEGNSWFRQQQLAEFAGADEAVAIPSAAIQAAVERSYADADPKLVAQWERILALDPAGKGSDDSVLTYRVGPCITKQEFWNGKDEMWTAGYTADKAVEFKAQRVVVDEVGLGAGVRSQIENILQDRIEVVGFNGGSGPRDTERFAYLKAEEIFKLRERFVNGEIEIPDDPKLIEQLCSYQIGFTPKGKTKVIDPEDSPDRADSLLMSFYDRGRGDSVRTMNADWL